MVSFFFFPLFIPCCLYGAWVVFVELMITLMGCHVFLSFLLCDQPMVFYVVFFLVIRVISVFLPDWCVLLINLIDCNFLNRIGGSGTDLRSKARVTILLLLEKIIENQNLVVVVFVLTFLFWFIDFFICTLGVHRRFLGQLVILQSFPSGITMVPAQVKLLVKTVKWSYSKLSNFLPFIIIIIIIIIIISTCWTSVIDSHFSCLVLLCLLISVYISLY